MGLSSNIDVLRNLGAFQTLHFAVQRFWNRVAAPSSLQLRSKYARYPVTCRRGTSDLEVFGQVFSHREYACLDNLTHADFVIDCGANVGFSSAYFLSRFPTASVVAIEPDEQNYECLIRHMLPYGARARAVRAGVWWRTAGLIVTDSERGDGRAWARCVREVRPGEQAEVEAVDIASVLHESGRQRISLLKMDIEGGELEIFQRPCPWLDLVDNLVIETHGPDCESSVKRACEAHGVRLRRYNDELMVGSR